MLSTARMVTGRRAASAAAASSSLSAAFDLRSSRLTSGLIVSSVDQGLPVAQLAIAFRAGSRHESLTEAGFSHRIRNALGGDSRRARGLTMLWQAGAIGATLRAHVDRENVVLLITLPRSHQSLGQSLLSELAQPKLEPWELEEIEPSLKVDLAYQPVNEKANQLLHRAAFRNGGLASSPLVDSSSLGSVDFHKLQEFAASRLNAKEAAVVGVNVDHGELLSFFSERAYIADSAKSSITAASPYLGGDSRVEGPSSRVAVSVAGEASSLADTKGLASSAVLLHLLNKEFSSSGASAFFLPYSDVGLLGFQLNTPASAETTGQIKNAVQIFKSLESKIDESSLSVAKSAATLRVLSRADVSSDLACSLASSLLVPGADVLSPSDVSTAIQTVSVNDAKQVAKKAAAKLSVGAYGNIRHVPYSDEL